MTAQLGAKVIYNEKVTLEEFVGQLSVLHALAELLGVKGGNKLDSGHVENVIALFNDLTRHGTGKMSLAKTCSAKEGKILRSFGGEILGVGLHDRKHALHTGVYLFVLLIIVKRKIVEGLGVQQVRDARGLKARHDEGVSHALTHFDAYVARIGALGAVVFDVGIVGRIACGDEEPVSLLIECEVLLLDAGKFRFALLHGQKGCAHEGKPCACECAIDLGDLG